MLRCIPLKSEDKNDTALKVLAREKKSTVKGANSAKWCCLAAAKRMGLIVRLLGYF
jgi:hypothetical protein